MVGYSSLEEQFAECLKEINQYKFVKDYKSMKTTIKKAMEICQRIHDETTSSDKKALMRKNAINLQQLYKQCQEHLGEEAELSYDNMGKKQSKTVTKKPVNNGNSNQSNGQELGDNIQYEFYGVDVKQFLTDESNDVVLFNDVIGMEDEKKLIKREFFLTDKQREFKKSLGMKPKTFILLYGVPGTGKTFFAKAISCELKERNKDNSQVPFFSVVGSQLKDCKVGGSEKNIQALFEFCKQFKHCVLFIDEFDTLVPDRAKNTGDPTAQSTVTTFLQMMDGFSSAAGTLLIAATNCPYNIDGGVLSRASEEIEIPLPSKEVILSTLERKIKNKIASDVSLDNIADHLIGYSNRDIKKYIASLKDQLFDNFSEDQENGIEKNIEEYEMTNEMFNKAFVTIPSSVKENDKRLIKQYQLSKGQN